MPVVTTPPLVWVWHVTPFNCKAASGPESTAVVDKWQTAGLEKELEGSVSTKGQREDSPSPLCLNSRMYAERAGCREHMRCVFPDEGLTVRQVKEAVNLIMEYEDLFVGPDGKVGQTSLVKHTIDVGDDRPFRLPVRRFGVEDREIEERELGKIIAEGKLIPSKSPWASLIVLVKKDGSTRVCCDYNKLNDVTIKDGYPLPHITDLLGYYLHFWPAFSVWTLSR